MVKRTISADLEGIRYSLEGALDKAVTFLSEKKAEFEALGWSNLRIDIDTEDDYGYTTVNINIMGDRLETDEEEAAREQRTAEEARRQRLRDEMTYRNLQAKLGIK